MRIEILENCFPPVRPAVKSHAPSILERGTFVDLPDDQAKTLIDKGVAAKAPEASEDSDSGKKKSKKASSDDSDK
jgi:hypothetical protein